MTEILYTMATAKEHFHLGLLSGFGIERLPMGGGWSVLLESRKTSTRPLLDARQKQPRVFKTLDAAVSAVEEIGFKVEMLIRGKL